MFLIGITGGLGMGKSTAEAFLRERGVRTVDTDQLARELVQPGQPALEEIRRRFGGSFLDPDGRLRRGALADLVFGDEQARRVLEAILHPRIREQWSALVAGWRDEGVRFGAVVIPLLFETGAAPAFDLTACIACSPATQHARLQSRGWPEQDIRRRLAAQWPVEHKMAAADVLVWTEGILEAHAAQWERVLASLTSAE